MKKYFYIPLFILLALFISSCQSSNTSKLEATNQALSSQLNSLVTQLTQQAALPTTPAQPAPGTSTQNALPTSAPLASPSPLPTSAGSAAIAQGLIFSGSGTLTPWSNKTAYPSILFGAANVHLICSPNDSEDGKVWIDNKNYSVGCTANSEVWIPWKADISVGDHYIYQTNADDQYEFWTVGTTPFTIHNKYAHSDFMFMINNAGIYNLSANVGKGEFNLYITCEGAQNFNYRVSQSTSIQVVLNPGRCELLIRDTIPVPISQGEIEVSLEAAK